MKNLKKLLKLRKGNTLNFTKAFRFAYTLSEIIIVMLIIAVVVPVTIQGTKLYSKHTKPAMHYAYLTPFNTLFTQEAYAKNLGAISCDKYTTCSSGYKITDGSRCACVLDVQSFEDAIIALFPDNPDISVTPATCLQRFPYPGCAIDEVYNIMNCRCEPAPEPEEPICYPTESLLCNIRIQNGENVYFDEERCECLEKPSVEEPEPTPEPEPEPTPEPEPEPEPEQPVNPPITPSNPNNAQIDTGEYGYKVYVDIDGDKGSSTLWEDVFPFYITLSGQVIPVFNTVDGNPLGGNSNEYLQTSVQYEHINNAGRRKLKWLSKSVSFKEGACKSGFINSSTPYCSGVSEHSECSSAASGSKCTLKIVKPVKFF